MKTLNNALALARPVNFVAADGSPRQLARAEVSADCGTSLDVQSRTEYCWSASDLLAQVQLNSGAPVVIPVPTMPSRSSPNNRMMPA